MTLINHNHRSKVQLDLAGPDGNAFVLCGYARSYGRGVLGLDEAEIRAITTEMRSGTYKHLVETFDKHFGDFVDLILPPNWD